MYEAWINSDLKAVADRIRPVSDTSLVNGATSDLVDTALTELLPAPGADNYNYVTQILVTNSHASVGTFVSIWDDTGTNYLYSGYAASGGGGFSITFTTAPLKQGIANKRLMVKCETTGANVRACATGYVAT